ncbi:MAG: hypothetical protein IMW89_01490 [Ktedonobacteraceae bacterium]|nr:hypothetical protein [Ktedonobacteraceae bacterium]
MDSSLQHTNVAQDETAATRPAQQAIAADEGPHIHMPNPSLWPLILGVGVLVAGASLLFLPDSLPFLVIVAALVLFGIMGWALEDPMAPPKEEYIVVPTTDIQSRFHIGQEVFDKEKHWVGVVQARFQHYLLVERGTIAVKAFYVPHRLIDEGSKGNILRLTVSEPELLAMGANSVPDDLYEEIPEYGMPQVRGVPLFARGPLSPAETGHYNYGPNFPGINTDASGSYFPEDVRPTPQKYVADRRKWLGTSRTIPPMVVSSN